MTPLPSLRSWLIITVLTAVITLGGRAVMPWERMFPDLLCYWTAGRLVAHGQNPYDPVAQTKLQTEQGWDKAKQGRGVLEYLPYYYPPWFALACVPLAKLDLAHAKLGWFFVNTWLLVASGVLLRDALPGLPRTIAVAIVPCFFLSFL